MNSEAIKEQWNEQGYVVVPELFDAGRVEQLREICDQVLEQCIRESDASEEAANSSNMAFMTEPRYFERHPERLKILLEAIADKHILAILKRLFDIEPLFHNA